MGIYEKCVEQQHILDLYAVPVQQQDPKDNWYKFMKENKVTFTDDVLTFHRYKDKFADRKVSTAGASGRNNTISKEIANMTTSLPDNIFLKVAERRSDVMKALIVGVQGTPYEGGLFPFDIYLDSQYPKTPPKMTFTLDRVDEDGDGFPINPNLHMGSGTVCLSILNTWDGDASQKWQPNKSTLLSVLVSVQAMILGAPCPYLNEPGRETYDVNSPQAVADTKRTQAKVLRRGIIPWLEKLKTIVPNDKDAIWDEISAMYWKHHAAAIQKVVDEWATTNSSLNYTPNSNKDFNSVLTLKKLVEWVEENSNKLGVPKPEEVAETDSLTKKRKRENSSGNEDHAKKKWKYTGGKSLKEVRIACSEIGVKSARSIQESIERLEEALNDESVSSEHMELAKKWGVLQDA